MNINKNLSIYVIYDILLIPVYFSRNILLSFSENYGGIHVSAYRLFICVNIYVLHIMLVCFLLIHTL